MRHILPAYFLILLLFTSCATPSVREAREVLAECDSLRAAGQLYADSARLADIVTSLNPIRIFYPDDYAKANYYYGRLLRNRDNYVAAMQCFIDATESNTDNHEIMARSYSNMGSMCHLADSFALSYLIYEKSANCFYLVDSVAYYYAIYNMAYEKAEMADIEQTLNLLNIIENQNNIPNISDLTNLTKARLYYKCEQYDSTLYFANLLYDTKDLSCQRDILKAQAFSLIGEKDSAIYYAQLIMHNSTNYQNKYNALYILSHDYSYISNDSLTKLNSERIDIRHYQYEPQQRKLTEAIMLLRRSINNKHYTYRDYLLWILFTILLMMLPVLLFKEKRKHLKQKIQRLTSEQKQLKNINEMLSKQQQSIKQTNTELFNDMISRVERNAKILYYSNNFKDDLCWNDYHKMCVIVNNHFFMLANKLEQTAHLSEKEIRLCILVLIGFNRIQIAELLPYSKSGVGKLKDTIAKKLGTSGQNLKNYLKDTAIGL